MELTEREITEKYTNFKNFIELNIKENHKTKLNLLPSSSQEFIFYMLTLDYDNVNDMINQLSESFNISKDEYDPKIYDKFKLYLELFYDISQQIKNKNNN